MSFANEEDVTLDFNRKTEPIPPAKIKYRDLEMRRRLNTCYSGLLEVNTSLPEEQLIDEINTATQQEATSPYSKRWTVPPSN